MSCLTASLSRVGWCEAYLSPASGVSAGMEREGSASAYCVRAGGLSVSLSLVVDFSATFSKVCATNIRVPYLEIEPEILWIADWGANDVLSNTNWNVD